MAKLIIFAGPSGAGKSTIVKHLMQIPELALHFSVSATSRPKRENETDGSDYFFLSIDEFKSRIEENRFLEWEEVYPNQYYGTLKADVDRMLNEGKNLIFDVDVMGAINIKRSYKDISKTIFIQPPSIEVLEDRLKARNTENDASLAKRVRKAKMELHYAKKFDTIVVNDNLETTIAEVEKLARAFFLS